jgi:hypothetical protein
MSDHATWPLLSCGIMVVATRANLYEKVESRQKRLEQLEPGDGAADDCRYRDRRG